MKYVELEDLIEVIQERLLNESVELKEELLDRIEQKQIDFVISFISGKYDTSKIFGNPVLRNGVLVQIISMLVVYRCVRRNAARKVPEDFPDLYAEAKEMLLNIQRGSQTLDGLPEVTGEDGTPGDIMWGNNTNINLFI